MSKKAQVINTAVTGEQPTAPVESKADRFVRLAVSRVNKLVPMLRQIRNLSNKMNYEYTDEQAEKVCRAIYKEVDKIEKAFKGEEQKAEGFTL